MQIRKGNMIEVCRGRIACVPQQNCNKTKNALSKIIQQFKSTTTKQIRNVFRDAYNASPTNEMIIWQRSFYDHVVRNEKSYLEILKYIDENPLKWQDDKYYIGLKN